MRTLVLGFLLAAGASSSMTATAEFSYGSDNFSAPGVFGHGSISIPETIVIFGNFPPAGRDQQGSCIAPSTGTNTWGNCTYAPAFAVDSDLPNGQMTPTPNPTCCRARMVIEALGQELTLTPDSSGSTMYANVPINISGYVIWSDLISGRTLASVTISGVGTTSGSFNRFGDPSFLPTGR